MTRKPDLSCADCGEMMWRGSNTLPQGQATCLSCRRARNPKKPPEAAIGSTTRCRGCGHEFIRTAGNQAYCWSPCTHPKSGATDKPASAAERGYGPEHERARKLARAAWQDGDPCARCGGQMRYGTPVDLDHSDDRTGYLGLSHAGCNRSSTGRLQAVKHDKVCDHCGIAYATRYAEQRYCSVPCRQAVAKAPRVKVIPARWVPELRVCTECPTMFVQRTARQITCSKVCSYQRGKRMTIERYHADETFRQRTIDNAMASYARRKAS